MAFVLSSNEEGALYAGKADPSVAGRLKEDE
jgi:hypothetical protein